MNKIYFIIGASGSGKTIIIKNVEQTIADYFYFFYFDSVGVPSHKKMIRDYGSGEEWQKIITRQWVEKITTTFIEKKPTILDGQTRLSFIVDACEVYKFTNYKIILLDCSDEVRKQRLLERGHAELADEQMMSWAKYLREESNNFGYTMIDNSRMTIEETTDELLKILNEQS